MTRAILLFIVFLLLLRLLWRLLGGIVQGAMSAGTAEDASRRASGGPPAVKMARDPICGTYVVPGKAISAVSGGAPVYFCSEKCRAEYRA